MGLSVINGLRIVGEIHALPSHKVDNLQASFWTKEQAESFVNHTNIRFRHVAQKNSSLTNYFSSCTDSLIKEIGWEKSSVDIIVVVTQSANTPIPSIACKIQGDLSFTQSSLAFDINSGCSGFVYGLHTVSSLLQSLGKKQSRAILCCGDFSNHLIEEGDLSVQPIFSDAVSAVAIEHNQSNKNEWHFNLETFGEGQEAIHLENTPKGNFMRMNGIDVFNYAVQYVPSNIETLLQEFNIDLDDMDGLVLHQANQLINQSIRKSIGFDEEKTPSTLHEFGNTSSASIPICFHKLLEQNKEADKIIMSGFGVGFSVGSAQISIKDMHLCKPLYITD